MDTSQYSSLIRTYTDNYHNMRVSNDTDRSDHQDLYSLGVVDLDCRCHQMRLACGLLIPLSR